MFEFWQQNLALLAYSFGAKIQTNERIGIQIYSGDQRKRLYGEGSQQTSSE